MGTVREWPAIVAVRPAFFGCETGCDGLECAAIEADDDPADQSAGRRLRFEFGYDAKSEAEARELFEIPAGVEVRFVPGVLEV